MFKDFSGDKSHYLWRIELDKIDESYDIEMIKRLSIDYCYMNIDAMEYYWGYSTIQTFISQLYSSTCAS